MQADAVDENLKAITPIAFNPDPNPDYLIYITEDRTLQLGSRIYDALAASGYAITKLNASSID